MPRIFTPPLRELTPDTSLGFSVIRFAEEILAVVLFPWQKWLLIHALELLEDGTFRFRNVIVLVARQNGKSTLSKVLALWWLYVYGYRLVLGTAQDLDTAEEVWEGAVELANETPALAEVVKNVTRRNGHRALELDTGEKYRVKAANRSAGRGLTGHGIMLDELREHLNWNAWGAITKTTMAIANAQVWGFSNAGDITSVVLKYLRMMAHEALGDPDGICAAAKILAPTVDDLSQDLLDELDDGEDLDDEDLEVDAEDLFIAEWSAPPGCDKWDRDGWAQANPSLGWSISERTIRSACKTDPEWVFRTEVLCQWPEGGMAGPFKTGTWDGSLNPTVETGVGPVLAPEDWIASDDLVACVAVAADRSRAHICVGGRRRDGLAQVELHAARHGVEWVRDWLWERRDRIRAVTGQTAGEQVSPLMEELAADRTFTIPIVPWQGRDLAAAHGAAYDAVRDGKVRHNPQILLDLAAAAAAKKPLAGGWVINLAASPGDAAPLQAFIGCLWLLNRPLPELHPPAKPQAVQSDATRDASAVTVMPLRSGPDLSTVRF